MSIYGYPCEYPGYIQSGGILPPPLDQYPQFTDLPAEIQLEILKHTIGDTARGLAWLEQVSKQWRQYVNNYLWPLFVGKNFLPNEIGWAAELLRKNNQPRTYKNAYRYLSNPPLVLEPGIKAASVTFKATGNVFGISTYNPGKYSARISVFTINEKNEKKIISSGQRIPLTPFNSRILSTYGPNTLYQVIVCCLDSVNCNIKVRIAGEISSYTLTTPYNITTPFDREHTRCGS